MTAREEQLKTIIAGLRTELAEAEEELTRERFKDVPRLAVGTEVLVPRLLFGKKRLWPAKIASVHFDHSSGHDAHGEPWERKTVSYSVYLQQRDGEYGGSSEGVYHSQVQLAPKQTAPNEQMLEDAVTAYWAQPEGGSVRTAMIAALTAANLWGEGEYLDIALAAFDYDPARSTTKASMRQALTVVLGEVNKKENL